MNNKQFREWLQNCDGPSRKPTKPLIMGVLNITPDSFFDGGRYVQFENAYQRAMQMIEQGVDIIDIGGESTRPGAQIVSVEEELARVLPIIKRIRSQHDVLISIDTNKADVMSAAVDAGAAMINDVFALQNQHALSIAAKLDVPICLMHMQGTPRMMQKNPTYATNVVDDIVHFFQTRIDACVAAGVDKQRLILDPGFGFGKLVEHNLMLLKHLKVFQQFNLPVLLGVSRKSTIGAILNKTEEERLYGGLALAVYAALHGVSIIRTHDVDETNQALTMISAIDQLQER